MKFSLFFMIFSFQSCGAARLVDVDSNPFLQSSLEPLFREIISPSTAPKLYSAKSEQLKSLSLQIIDRFHDDLLGGEFVRAKPLYLGIPIHNLHLIGKIRANGTCDIMGDMCDGVEEMGNIDPRDYNPLEKMEKFLKESYSDAEIRHKNSEMVIFCERDGQIPRVAYLIGFSYFSEKQGLKRLQIVLDANNNEVLSERDDSNLFSIPSEETTKGQFGSGPGGNEKIGKYEYGNDKPNFWVTQRGERCYLESRDVKTVRKETYYDKNEEPFSFECPRNPGNPNNGGYAPMNDAHYNAQKVFDIFRDWYNMNVVNGLVTVYFYNENVVNAGWDPPTLSVSLYNGGKKRYGGTGNYYPLTTLPIVAHELCHGLSIGTSNVGELSDTFSDMCGKMAEYYENGQKPVDPYIGGGARKEKGKALRYFDDPTKDGMSIAHMNDYDSKIEQHYSGGIFNKAFWLLLNTEGWNPKTAFSVFLRANRCYWRPFTGFKEGAEGVIKAAIDMNCKIEDVCRAFAGVGLYPPGCPPKN